MNILNFQLLRFISDSIMAVFINYYHSERPVTKTPKHRDRFSSVHIISNILWLQPLVKVEF